MAPSEDMDVGQVGADEGRHSVGEDGKMRRSSRFEYLCPCASPFQAFSNPVTPCDHNCPGDLSSDRSGFFYCSASLFNVAEGGRGSLRSGVTLLWVGGRKKRDEREK